MRKIGILGGSFNPIHNAHLSMAKCAFMQFDLDDMWLIPAKFPPHKQDVAFDDNHRLNMLRLAVSDYPELSIHLYEYYKDGLSYTVETLKALNDLYPETEFYFIMGEDSLYDFPKWYHPEEIAKLATLVVACREEQTDEFEELLCKRREEFGNSFPVLHMNWIPISSTDIRENIKNDKDIISLVPQKVADYIFKNHLYC